jgi:hypothetical protein
VPAKRSSVEDRLGRSISAVSVEQKDINDMKTRRFHDARNNGFVQRYKNVNESITIDTEM